MRQEVVANQHAEKNEIIDQALDIEGEGGRNVLCKLQGHVLSQGRDVQQLEPVWMKHHALLQRQVSALAKDHFFTEQRKVGLMCSQRQHDQIRIQTIHTMPYIRVIVWLGFATSNVVDNFVLTLSRHVWTRQHNCHLLPQWVLFNLLLDEKMEVLCQTLHELCPWRDAVRVEWSCIHFLTSLQGTLQSLSSIVCSPEASRPLLVHLRPRCTSINGHVEELLWLDDVEKPQDVLKSSHKYLFLICHTETTSVVVGAGMNYAVHVQVQVVKLRYHVRDDVLIDEREPLRQVSKEPRDAHDESRRLKRVAPTRQAPAKLNDSRC
mmetsp:Transcript_72871/g.173594  ORF Transcript_72871/g.173594 Transcript_72871/m.173594 type:complete len:321 (-) Transcript_72871:17-979(-)